MHPVGRHRELGIRHQGQSLHCEGGRGWREDVLHSEGHGRHQGTCNPEGRGHEDQGIVRQGFPRHGEGASGLKLSLRIAISFQNY